MIELGEVQGPSTLHISPESSISSNPISSSIPDPQKRVPGHTPPECTDISEDLKVVKRVVEEDLVGLTMDQSLMEMREIMRDLTCRLEVTRDQVVLDGLNCLNRKLNVLMGL